MKNYRHLFNLPENIHYINGAYMSPLLNQVMEAGQKGLLLKSNPTAISPNDFFQKVALVKSAVGQLINVEAKQVAIIPAASYAFANAFNNLQSNGRKKAITMEGEFPSGYFAIKKWCDNHGVELQIITKSKTNKERGAYWNQELLDAINEETAVVLISSLHWMDGTRFDCEAIGKKCAKLGVAFFVDGTQTIGAQRMDVAAAHIDLMVVAAYKWLLGPYSIGFAYYSERFNNGVPIEESWMNRHKAADFANLTDYHESYQPGARKFDIGESANFILTPMMLEGVNFLLDFGVENIEDYCQKLSMPLLEFLGNNNYWTENVEYRSKHLFGFELPPSIAMEKLQAALKKNNIYLSYRKSSIRVSPNIYNTEEDIQALINCLKNISA